MSDDIKKITDERGKNYGHPKKHFTCTHSMFRKWEEAREESQVGLLGYDKEDALRHGVYMILDKLARMAENPEHMDNIDDIQGYAHCIKMILEE